MRKIGTMILILEFCVLLFGGCNNQGEAQLTSPENEAEAEMTVPEGAPFHIYSSYNVDSTSAIDEVQEQQSVSILKLQGAFQVLTSATDISFYNETLYKTSGGTPDASGNFSIAKTKSPQEPEKWVTIPGMAVRLDAGSNYLWVVQHDGNIHRYNYATGTWEAMLLSQGRDVAVSKKDGTPAVIFGALDANGDYPVYVADNASVSSWTAIGGAYRISIDHDGRIWVVQWDGDVFCYTNGSWAYFGNPAPNGTAKPDIAATGSGASFFVLVIGKDGRVYEYGALKQTDLEYLQHTCHVNYAWNSGPSLSASAVTTTGYSPGLCGHPSEFYAVDPDGQYIYKSYEPTVSL